jgi:hypothetical protein
MKLFQNNSTHLPLIVSPYPLARNPANPVYPVHIFNCYCQFRKMTLVLPLPQSKNLPALRAVKQL